jgi:poly-gamma-glutamate synthesis protein (capsule biosynthesis protein)
MLIILIYTPSFSQDAWKWSNSPKDGVTILLMGDTNIQGRIKPEEAFQFLIPTFRNADLKFLNLEGTLAGSESDPAKSSIPHKDWSHSDSSQVTALVAAEIDAVGVANNVTYPWQDMVKGNRVLNSAGIAYSGGGLSKAEAERAVIFDRSGVKIAFVQYAATVYPSNHAATENQPGIAAIKVITAYQAPPNLDKPGQPPIVLTWLDYNSKEELAANLKSIKKEVDVLIFSIHWGVSDTYEPVQYQHELGRLAIESGADIVMGHGTHRYQMIEMYKGKPIFHGLGQGIFDDTRKDRGMKYREGLLVRLLIEDQDITGVSLVPTWREDQGIIKLMDPTFGKGQELYRQLLDLTKGNASLTISGQEIIVKPSSSMK